MPSFLSTQVPLSLAVSYVGDGAQQVFSFSFPICRADDIRVMVDGYWQDGGYVVATTAGGNGGTVSFSTAPQAGQQVLLCRQSVLSRLTTFSESGFPKASPLNQEFDLLLAAAQDAALCGVRSLRTVPEDTALSELPVSAERAGRILGFDIAGNPAVTRVATPALVDNVVSAALAKAASAELAAVPTLPSLTELAALPPWPGAVVATQGCRQPDDCGGGLFRWLPDASGADGGTRITSQVAAGLWCRDMSEQSINVRWFGARGNGSDDDTDAFDAAITALAALGGGTLMVPAGTYATLRGLRFHMGRLKVQGAGRDRTVIRKLYTCDATASPPDALARGDVVSICPPAAGGGPTADKVWPPVRWVDGTYDPDWSGAENDLIKDIELCDLTIDANRWHFAAAAQRGHGGTGPHCLRLGWADRVAIRNVRFLRPYRCGVMATGVYHLRLSDCAFEDFGEQGFQLTGGEHFTLQGNHFLGNATGLSATASLTAMDLEPDSGAVGVQHIRHGAIVGNVVKDCRFGIVLTGMKNISLNQNAWSAASTYETGDTVTDAGGLYVAKVDGGQAVAPGGDGANTYWLAIDEAEISHIAINGNTVFGCDGDEGYALAIGKYNKRQHHHITVTGNHFHHQGTVSAVWLVLCRDVVLSGNQVEWPTEAPANSQYAAIQVGASVHRLTLTGNSVRTNQGMGLFLIGPSYGGEDAAVVATYIQDVTVTGNLFSSSRVEDGVENICVLATHSGMYRRLTISGNLLRGYAYLQSADNNSANCTYSFSGNSVHPKAITDTALIIARNQDWGVVDGNWFNGVVQVNRDGSTVSRANFGANHQEGWNFTTGSAAMAVADTRQSTFSTFFSNGAAPASSTTSGAPGEMRVDGGYLYLCRSPTEWVRVAAVTSF